MSVEQSVKQIIVEQLGVDESQVDNTASFVDDLGKAFLQVRKLFVDGHYSIKARRSSYSTVRTPAPWQHFVAGE